MLRSFAGIGRILWMTWPALLAWYLGGSLVRAAVIALAAPIGPQSALAALLLVPIAVLARLVSYIGMFLVVRRAMRNYARISAGDVSHNSFRDLMSEFSRVLVASILPFFFLYGLIGLLAADLSDYARSAFRYSLGAERGVLDVGDGPLVIAVIAVAFGGRMLLKALGPRLPRWVAIVEIYLEATWIFVTLSGLSGIFGAVSGWVSERRLVKWIDDGRDWLSDLWAPIRYGIDGFELITPLSVELILLPLAWLLIAGVVYTRSLRSVAEQRTLSPRLEAQLRLRMLRVPPFLRKRSRFITDEWEDIWSPFTLAARTIWSSGIRYLTVFVVAYALLYAAGQWLSRGLYSAIGAHDKQFWFTVDPLATLVLNIVIEPVRIALLAAVFDWCLGKWAERRGAAKADATALTLVTAVPEPSAEVRPVLPTA